MRFHFFKFLLCSSSESRLCKRYERFVLFFFNSLSQFALCPERSTTPLFFGGIFFSFLQCMTFTAVKKSSDCAQTWPTEMPLCHASLCCWSTDTAEVVPLWRLHGLKHRTCSWCGSVTSLQTQLGGWGMASLKRSRCPSGAGCGLAALF